jgi:hypothetical protein
MKKLFILFGLFLTVNLCHAQPSIDDLYEDIDLISVDNISASGNTLWSRYNSNINYIFDEIPVIKRNNIVITPPAGSAIAYLYCPCGYKVITLSKDNFTDVKFSPIIKVINDYVTHNNISEVDQKEDSKEMLDQIMAWLKARNIDISAVQNIDINFTSTSGGEKPMWAASFNITYRVCMPCPH